DFRRAFYVWDFSFPYYGIQRDWGTSYVPVYYSNLVLELLEKHERTSDNYRLWDNVKGSALFFRAFYFYNLLVQFGLAYDESTSREDLGIVIRLETDFNKILPRSSVEESFK